MNFQAEDNIIVTHNTVVSLNFVLLYILQKYASFTECFLCKAEE
jgi:hypothetical protein